MHRELQGMITGDSSYGEVIKRGPRIIDLYGKCNDRERHQYLEQLAERRKAMSALLKRTDDVVGEDMHHCKSIIAIIDFIKKTLGITR